MDREKLGELITEGEQLLSENKQGNWQGNEYDEWISKYNEWSKNCLVFLEESHASYALFDRVLEASGGTRQNVETVVQILRETRGPTAASHQEIPQPEVTSGSEPTSHDVEQASPDTAQKADGELTPVETWIAAIRDEKIPLDFAFTNDARLKNAVASLVEIGMPAVEPLLAAIQGDVGANIVLPVTYSYYVEALGRIGDPRAIEPLATLQQDVDRIMNLPHLFADVAMPRYQHLRESIGIALAACRSGPQTTPPVSVEPVAQATPVVGTISNLDETIQKYVSKEYTLLSRTGTSASLKRQAPINWVILIGLLFIFPIGALIYYLARKKYQVQLVQQADGRVAESGGTLAEFERDRAVEAQRPTSGYVFVLVGILIAGLAAAFGLILLLANSDSGQDLQNGILALLACALPIGIVGLLLLGGGVYILYRAGKKRDELARTPAAAPAPAASQARAAAQPVIPPQAPQEKPAAAPTAPPVQTTQPSVSLEVTSQIKTLEETGDITALIAALQDTNLDVRRTAVKALKKREEPEARLALQDLIRPGMSAQEVTFILGSPTSRKSGNSMLSQFGSVVIMGNSNPFEGTEFWVYDAESGGYGVILRYGIVEQVQI